MNIFSIKEEKFTNYKKKIGYINLITLFYMQILLLDNQNLLNMMIYQRSIVVPIVYDNFHWFYYNNINKNYYKNVIL